MDLEAWFKINTNVCNIETTYPETIHKFYQFCDAYQLKEDQMKFALLCLSIFKSITEIQNI